MMFVEHLLEPGTLSLVFQPIVDCSGPEPVLCAVEALTRGPVGTHFERAPVLFDYVRLKREEVRFDRHGVATALAAASSLPDVTLSVNVHAATLERDESFARYVETAAAANDFDPTHLMIELVEQSSYFDPERLLAAIRRLRFIGVRIALDDVGLGSGNYRTIIDARPDCLKIDRYFIAGCATDRYRRSIIRSLHLVAADFGATLIAEGVESEADLEALREIGITRAQGYLFGRPAEPLSLHHFGVASLHAMATNDSMEGV
jgi:EAL domain-containing protein (putative c-di-GMP-specific phosphodiesterase class I)